jgi:hypothetical protein
MTKYILSVCALLLIGCATLEDWKQRDLFHMTSESYEQALLSGQYREAIRFIKVQSPEQPAINFKWLKKIKVTSYDIVTTEEIKEKLSVLQTVEINYYNKDYLVEKILVDKQLWKYDVKDKTWYLHSSFPDFK